MDVVTIVASLLSASIGSATTILAYTHGFLNIERVERRKQKIALVQEVMAARYVLVDGYIASDSDVRDVNRALSLIPYVFSDNPNVTAAYDRFVVNKSDDNLLDVLDQIAIAAGVKKFAISRQNLGRVVSVPRSRAGTAKQIDSGLSVRVP
ncbi:MULTISPECIES: hypothetical protein [Bradyrhizobium]|uniref:hypothetical protein n=1 Tax=Bradyrhizobium TaxID=374 RepID=UPI000841B239|nr:MULTISPECIES: hypothetical protein [Bradyrhizobium]MCA6103607.1 hypothetical protein [Bradyrhizobium australafricanum]ODM75019.1 hypothetical protein A6452_38860 [Bradyrhizobium elkanii]ODM82795.1 hypothetical protein A6X20_16900 [Bradyrhizobium elkanii]